MILFKMPTKPATGQVCQGFQMPSPSFAEHLSFPRSAPPAPWQYSYFTGQIPCLSHLCHSERPRSLQPKSVLVGFTYRVGGPHGDKWKRVYVYVCATTLSSHKSCKWSRRRTGAFRPHCLHPATFPVCSCLLLQTGPICLLISKVLGCQAQSVLRGLWEFQAGGRYIKVPLFKPKN